MAEIRTFPAPHRTETPERTDAEARLQAVDVRRSWIVEAPAGSGKTSLLVARYLRLLAEAELDGPESVLAITFTRKATAELRERMLRLLTEAAEARSIPVDASVHDRQVRGFAAAALERSQRLGWQLLDRPSALNIRTIDGLCAEIAQSLPLRSGGGGRRQPVTDPRSLYQLAAERTLRRLGGADPQLHESLRILLLHRDADLRDTTRLLAGMLAEREQWGQLVPLSGHELTETSLDEVRRRLETSLDRLLCETLDRVRQLIPESLLQELSSLAAGCSALPGYKDFAHPLACCAGLHHPPEAITDHLDHWLALANLLLTGGGEWRTGFAVSHLRFEATPYIKQQLRDLLAALQQLPYSESLREALHELRELPPAIFPDDQWEVCRALFRLLRHALAELDVLFGERGECDFAAISLAARSALRQGDALHDLASAGYRLSHLLVDELQDTSAAQFELFELLTRHFDGSSNTVFLVGDPKQSIYLFRQARVERFLHTASSGLLGDVPLSSVRLLRNFRSQGSLVAEFNNIFRAILASPAEASLGSPEVPFVEAEPNRLPVSGVSAAWHTAILSQTDLALDHAPVSEISDPMLRHRAREARLTRQLILDFQRRWPGHPSNHTHRAPSMAVLCRNRSHVEAITAELRLDRTAEGFGPPIPFRGTDLERLHERPEVFDLLALTRALLHPVDRTAWLAVLHAPWCGLTLADLLVLTGEGEATDATTPIPELLSSRCMHLSLDGQARLGRIAPVLQAALTHRHDTPLPALLERTWLALGGRAYLDPPARENARSYLRLLASLVRDGAAPAAEDLQTRLRDLFAAPQPSGDVEITTIHKSKGREWDLVILPALERRGRGADAELLRWVELENTAASGSPGSESSLILAPIQGKHRDGTMLYRWLGRLEADRALAERKRLFYVACTRAKEELHLIAAAEIRANGELRTDSSSLLAAAWPFAKTQFQVPAPSRALAFSAPAPVVEEPPLALAAAAEMAPDPPILQRFPLGFDARPRLETPPLPYARPSASRLATDRPTGSLALRAVGNVVHRFLHHLAERLARPAVTADLLLAELSDWDTRLAAGLRGEGLAAALAARETMRVRQALQSTLADPVGRWLLSPHLSAVSEQPLSLSTGQTLRADRVFLAGPAPLVPDPSSPQDATLWIVDFKTTDPGGRAGLEEELRLRYENQLLTYAAVQQRLRVHAQPAHLRLALYLPLAARLIHWEIDGPFSLSDRG